MKHRRILLPAICEVEWQFHVVPELCGVGMERASMRCHGRCSEEEERGMSRPRMYDDSGYFITFYPEIGYLLVLECPIEQVCSALLGDNLRQLCSLLHMWYFHYERG